MTTRARDVSALTFVEPPCCMAAGFSPGTDYKNVEWIFVENYNYNDCQDYIRSVSSYSKEIQTDYKIRKSERFGRIELDVRNSWVQGCLSFCEMVHVIMSISRKRRLEKFHWIKIIVERSVCSFLFVSWKDKIKDKSLYACIIVIWIIQKTWIFEIKYTSWITTT